MNSSQHYVTLGLRFVEAFNRGDLDACVELLHPEIEWYSSNRFLESETHVGQGDVKLYLDSLHDHLDESRMTPEDGYQIGDHMMLVNSLRGKGTLAGNEVVERYNWVVLLQDGLFKRVVAYPTPAEARRALDAVANASASSNGN
jgi:ketosteroid isomerase-like protein